VRVVSYALASKLVLLYVGRDSPGGLSVRVGKLEVIAGDCRIRPYVALDLTPVR